MDVKVTQAGSSSDLLISGSVKTKSGAAIAGVTISLGNNGGTATTDTNGNYSMAMPRYGYSGTATPSKSGYTFTPAPKTYTNVVTNQTSQNYVGVDSTTLRNLFLGVWSDGVWTWDKSNGKWSLISSTGGASMIAAGKVDGDTSDDLIGVWPSGLYVKRSSDGAFVKLSTKIPTWIAVGDLNNDSRDDIIGT